MMASVVCRISAVTVACVCLLGAGVQADSFKGISDPTRPPAALNHAASAAVAGASAASDAASSALAGGADSESKLNLNAIRYDLDSGKGMAIVNDNVVGVGDAVGSYTVLAMTGDSVLLKNTEGVRVLRLFNEGEKVETVKKRRTAKSGRKEQK